ncbi:glycosyltransferase [Candidatus Poribacteria bacterium]|nr:glycosyltransferase [Candidatus Poribacteria bacterium]
MAAGFEFARGQRIVSMDGDLQNDPADIPKLLEKMDEGYDVVCEWRKERQDKFLTRRVPSIVANWIIGQVMGIPIHDNGCSLKAYRADIIKQVPLYGEMPRFIPAMSQVVGARIGEIVVKHHPRRFGKSKCGLGRIWRIMLDIIAFKLIISTFAPRRGTRKKSKVSQQQLPTELGMLARFFIFRCKQRPLRFFGRLGVILVLLGSFLLIASPSKGDFVIGVIWTSITGGFFIFGFGLLGEIISFANAKWVKAYTVETVLSTKNNASLKINP